MAVLCLTHSNNYITFLLTLVFQKQTVVVFLLLNFGGLPKFIQKKTKLSKICQKLTPVNKQTLTQNTYSWFSIPLIVAEILSTQFPLVKIGKVSKN